MRAALAALFSLIAVLTFAQTPLSGYQVEIREVDDVDVAAGQAVSVDPRGFDVKVEIGHPGQESPRQSGNQLSPGDAQTLGSSDVRFTALLPGGVEIALPTKAQLSPSGEAFAHLAIDQDSLVRIDALSNPQISIVATLEPKSGQGADLPSSRPIRLGFNVSALRTGRPELPYVYRKVENLSLKPLFAPPVSMRLDEAYLAGQTPSVPGVLAYYIWLRYTPAGETVSHFAAIAPPSANGWRTDLSFLRPGTYRLVAFASPHADTSTFAADGWRADAYAISPEVTETITPAGLRFTPQWLGILLGLLFIAAAMLTLRNPHSNAASRSKETNDEPPYPSFASRAHKALAWVLLALATVTIVNYYEFFTNVVATALRGDQIIGQDWNLNNSGGISLLIMSYSVSLGLCVELGLYKLITLWGHRRHYGAMAIPMALLWLCAVLMAGWCAFAFIIHIGAFYNTQPALLELGHLAGAAELVIFFCAVGGLMPMEHEEWPQRASTDDRKPAPALAAVQMDTPEHSQEPA